MVGGVPKLIEGDRAIRGSIHVSVTRDPESLIDELIESAAQLTPQSVLLSGGATGERIFTPRSGTRPGSKDSVAEYSIDTLSNASNVIRKGV
jgi:hypothetical protein